jgi:hypothetical protein
MAIHIIDNKKVDLTEDEWQLYQNICRSYDRPNFKGEGLFIDLWESDDAGRIVFLKPPSKRHTSLEVFLFIAAIQQQQMLRAIQAKADSLFAEMRNKINELDAKIKSV